MPRNAPMTGPTASTAAADVPADEAARIPADAPVSSQLDWLLRALGAPSAVDPGDATERLSDHLRASVPVPSFLAALDELAAVLGDFTVDRVDVASPYDVVARLFGSDLRAWMLRAIVEPEAPHRLMVVQVTPARVPTGQGCSAPVPWPEIVGDDAIAPPRHGSGGLASAVGADLQLRLTALREELRLPGLVAAVGRGGDCVFWSALGFAEVATRRRPSRRTALRVGAVSKVVTALAVLSLVEAGTVELDDPLGTHLRTFAVLPPAGGPPVRVRDVLAHTSGLLPQAATVTGVRAGLPIPTLPAMYAPALVADLPRGERVVYADENYAAAGQLVADVTGVPFEEYAAAAVLDPLGMRHTSYLLDDRVARQPMCGYDVDFDEVLVTTGTDVVVRPAGSLASTADDLLALTAALCSPERIAPVCGDALRGLVVSGGADTDLPGVRSALGMFTGELAGTAVAWHSGGWPGASAQLWVAPAEGIGLVLAANTFSPARLARLDGAAAELMDLLLTGLPPTPGHGT